MKQNKKKKIMSAIFDEALVSGKMEFDNDFVKKVAEKFNFANPFDATKLDSSDLLPENMKTNDYFLIHLGGGKHKFIKGIGNGYHKFADPLRHETFEYELSVLDKMNDSESNMLSRCNRHKIIHEFLYSDPDVDLNVKFSHRTFLTTDHKINGSQVQLKKRQLEIDLTTEYDGKLIVYEAKGKFLTDFAIQQLYIPTLFYGRKINEGELPISEINSCFIMHERDKATSLEFLRIYNYKFTDIEDMTSLKLQKSIEYELVGK